MTRVLALIVALLGGACDDESTRSVLDGPRVLAIVAEPPVLAPGSSAALEVIASVDGLPATPALVVWRVCSPYAVVVDPVRDCEGDNALELASDENGRAVVDARAVAERFAISLPTDVPPADSCALSSLALTIVAEVELGGARLVGKKQLAVAAKADRTNPAFVHVRVDGAAVADEASVEAGSIVSLTADIAVDTLDVVCGDDGAQRREEVRVFVYPGGGASVSEDSFEIVDRDGVITAGTVDLEVPAALGTLPLWLVAVDESGGAAATPIRVTAR